MNLEEYLMGKREKITDKEASRRKRSFISVKDPGSQRAGNRTALDKIWLFNWPAGQGIIG